MASPKSAESVASRASEKAAEFEWLHARREEERRSPSAASARLPAPSVVLCDEGELDDLHQLLRQLGQRPLRVRPKDIDELRDWERPTRLFATPVRVALAHELELIREDPELVSVAVSENDAHTVATAMMRRGFRYVLRRPVHPEALRLLLQQVLYRGPEQRRVTRFPFGGEVRWRSGLRRGHCVMSEISATGCRLLASENLARGRRLRIQVPPVLPGERALRLKGRVVRRELSDVGAGPRRTQVVVAFEGISHRARAHLDALLAERASGPAAAGGGGVPGTARQSAPRGPSRYMSLTEEQNAARGNESGSPLDERRRLTRSVWQGEVLTLDAGADRVQLSLVGTDLSERGMRVEPHPALQLGEALRIALYDARRAQPIVLEARVARDDGSRGCGLAFERLDAAARERLRALVAEGTPIADLRRARRPRSVVVGRIVVDPSPEGA